MDEIVLIKKQSTSHTLTSLHVISEHITFLTCTHVWTRFVHTYLTTTSISWRTLVGVWKRGVVMSNNNINTLLFQIKRGKDVKQEWWMSKMSEMKNFLKWVKSVLKCESGYKLIFYSKIVESTWVSFTISV